MLSWLRGYYAIVDATLAQLAGSSELAALEARAAELLAARPCCLQLRAKGADAAALQPAARLLRDRCRREGVPFCVNDRLDVALSVGAEICHLGQEDLPLADARRVRATTGTALVLGVSTHNLAQALAAAAGGADYLGFGPVFPTPTKLDPDPTVGLSALAEVCRAVALPVVAIGGISLDTVPAVAAAGAAAAALIAAIDRAPDRTAAALSVTAAFSAPAFLPR